MTKNQTANSFDEIFSIFRPTSKSSIMQIQEMLKSLSDHLCSLEQSEESLPNKQTASLCSSLLSWWSKSDEEGEAAKAGSGTLAKSRKSLEDIGILCGSCIFELLRLTAPDCPMTNRQLKVSIYEGGGGLLAG